jgi:hypothetical protein
MAVMQSGRIMVSGRHVEQPLILAKPAARLLRTLPLMRLTATQHTCRKRGDML